MISKGSWNCPQCSLFCNKVLEICSTSDSWELLLFDEVTTGNCNHSSILLVLLVAFTGFWKKPASKAVPFLAELCWRIESPLGLSSSPDLFIILVWSTGSLAYVQFEPGSFSFIGATLLISHPGLRNSLAAPWCLSAAWGWEQLLHCRQPHQLLVKILENQLGETGTVGFNFRSRCSCLAGRARRTPEFSGWWELVCAATGRHLKSLRGPQCHCIAWLL